MRRSLLVFARFSAAAFVAAAMVQGLGAQGKDDGSHWVATWAASPSFPMPDAARMLRQRLVFDNQTAREIVHISLGGGQFRVRLSNAFGTQAVPIAAAHIALRGEASKIAPGSDRALTFGGRPSVSIPPAAEVLSDPVDLKAPDSADLAVSLFLPAGPVTASAVHYSAMQTSYVAAGDQTAAAELTESANLSSWAFLMGVDVMAPKDSGTIVALGDSITDGARSTGDANRRWANVLADRLLAAKTGPRLAVVNAGIGGGRILHDGAGGSGPQYGPSALARLERDVLAQPGVKYVILLEGVNDIGHPGASPMSSAPMSETVTAEDMIAAMRQIIERAHERGVKVFGCTIMPFRTEADRDAKRKAVNEWIRTGKAFDGVIDFDKLVSDPASQFGWQAAYDSGDHLHPNDAGHKAMGEAIDLALFAK